jgi:hypothetical protein
MRWLGWMVPIVAAAAALFISPAVAMAAATSADSISGFEYAATSAQGRFVGIASGALPGAWSVTVDHTPLRTMPPSLAVTFTSPPAWTERSLRSPVTSPEVRSGSCPVSPGAPASDMP